MVIGYGNTLRGDDGVGPAVAALVGARVPAIRSLVVPMLTPELAPLLAQARVVVFVDARVGGEPGRVRVANVEPGGGPGPFGHLLSAEALLGLARALYASSAEAFQVSVDAVSLHPGAPMSPAVAGAVPRAADIAIQLLA
jgi:hydrogenase maturation protease